MQKSTLLSATIAIFGLLALALYLLLPINILSVSNQNQLLNLENNQKVFVQGLVTKQTESTIQLDNGLYAYCQSCKPLLNKTISAIAIVSDFYNNKTLQILEIKNSNPK